MKIEYPHRGFATRKPRSPLAGTLLQPAALVYRFASLIQRKRKGKGKGPAFPGIKVISVGNIEVGGGGKTPFCIYLLDYLLREGMNPVYVSRGYKSESEKLHRTVTVVMPEQADACPPLESGVRFLTRDSAALCEVIGDEGAVVAARNPDVVMVISRDKAEAVRASADLFKPSHIVMDDAFQSWGVYRDIDVVLLDAERPFGSGRSLPAGTLREGATALRRADAIGLNGIEEVNGLQRAAEAISPWAAPYVEVFGIVRKIRLLTMQGEDVGADEGPVAVLSSIARPGGFERLVKRCGCDVRLSIRFPDHFRYRSGDVSTIQRLARSNKIRRLITTEKDWVKLRSFGWHETEMVIARLDLSVQPENFLEKVKKPQATLAASI